MKRLIFDSHTHYDSKKFDVDRDAVLNSLPQNGVLSVVNAGSNLASSAHGISLSKKYGFMWAAVGIHPHDAEKTLQNADWEKELDKMLDHEKVVAVGETGLDYYYDFSPRDTQKDFFETHLKIAKEHDLPIIVHNRDAHADTLDLLLKYRPKGVVHAFSGSVEVAKIISDMGMYIGIGGVLTFKNAKKLSDVVASLSLDQILLETDAPYMAPEPLRGKRCDSSMIIHVAKKLAEIKGVSTEFVLEKTSENAHKLFNITQI